MVFKNRVAAGRLLANELLDYSSNDTIVYGLPRGGVEVAAEVAKRLDAPLELLIARKIGHPDCAEDAVGAVTETGRPFWNKTAETLDDTWLEQAAARERREAQRRRLVFIGNRPTRDASGKIALVVDDGIVTGLTIIAAVSQLRLLRPKTIIVATPAAHEQAGQTLAGHIDKSITLYTIPSNKFKGIGFHYTNFTQLEDSAVTAIMAAQQAK